MLMRSQRCSCKPRCKPAVKHNSNAPKSYGQARLLVTALRCPLSSIARSSFSTVSIPNPFFSLYSCLVACASSPARVVPPFLPSSCYVSLTQSLCALPRLTSSRQTRPYALDAPAVANAANTACAGMILPTSTRWLCETY
eukprot:6208700-Pleurochrysis_carterae.AAC.2